MTSTVPTEEEWLALMEKERESAEKGVSVQSHEHPNPTHPVQQLQGPFEESMFESVQNSVQGQLPQLDCRARRKRLLENESYERTCSGKWAQRSDEKYHPLWKLIAQLSFGLHLLVKGLAKSELEVMKILQLHVDELDGFLGRTTEDLDLAHSDIRERIRRLRVPMEHQRVFDSMLEERDFRSLIIDGNDKIEHVIERSALSMHDTLKDIRKAVDAVTSLGRYMRHIGKKWSPRPENLNAVFNAMVGNVEGWERALVSLLARGNDLGVSLIHLGAAASEMQRRVGIASRKNVVSLPPNKSGVSSKNKRFNKHTKHRSTSRHVDTKPLPDSPIIRTSIHEALANYDPPNTKSAAHEKKHRSHYHQGRSPPQPGIIARPQSISGPPGSVGLRAKKRKSVAWEMTIPDKLRAPATMDHRPFSAPDERRHLRSRSYGHGDSGRNGKSTTLRSILEPFLHSERKKPLSSPGKPRGSPRKHSNQRRSGKLKMAFPGCGQADEDSSPRRRSASEARHSAFNLFRARSCDDLRNSKNPPRSNKSTRPETPPVPESEQKFTWSDCQTNISSKYMLRPSSGSSSPRLPQPVEPYRGTARESLAKADQNKADAESTITALPPIGTPTPKNRTPRTVEERASGKASGYKSPMPISPPRHPPRNASRNINSKRATSSNSAGQSGAGSSSRGTPLSHGDSIKSSLPFRDLDSTATTSATDSRPLVRPRHRKNSSLRIHVTNPGKSKFGSSLAPGTSLVEQLASTPPASPIHHRTPPVSSDGNSHLSKTNRLDKNQSSRSRLGLGVRPGLSVDSDNGSPPPPGPGGRTMVTPDYGAQSAFEGERQRRVGRSISAERTLTPPERSLRRFFRSFVGGGPGRNQATASASNDWRPPPISKDPVPVGQQNFRRSFHGVANDGSWVAS